MASKPPQNLEAEQATLGCLLLDPTTLPAARLILDEYDFYRDAHRFIFEAVAALSERKAPIDVLSLTTELEARGNTEPFKGHHDLYLLNLMQAPSTAANISHYASLVKDCSLLRRGMDSVRELAELLKLGKEGLTEIQASNGRFHFSELLMTHDDNEVMCLEDVPLEFTSFLWKPWLPWGNIAMFSGDPGVFKSGICVEIAARLTTGRAMPLLILPTEPANVLGLIAEDGVGDTVKQRLLAAGGDPKRFFALTPEKFPILDIAKLRRFIHKHKIKLIYADPLASFLPKEVENSKQMLRQQFLYPLYYLMHETGCCFIAIMHLNKGSGGGNSNALYRSSGFLDYVAVARSAVTFGHHPDDKDKFLMASGKVNLGRKPQSLIYRIAETEDEVPFVQWEGVSDEYTADNMLSATPRSEEDKSALAEAKDFLEGELENGAKPAGEMIASAKKAGITEATLKRARIGLTKKPYRSGGYAEKGCWMWELANPPAPKVSPTTADEFLNDEGERDPFAPESE